MLVAVTQLRRPHQFFTLLTQPGKFRLLSGNLFIQRLDFVGPDLITASPKPLCGLFHHLIRYRAILFHHVFLHHIFRIEHRKLAASCDNAQFQKNRVQIACAKTLELFRPRHASSPYLLLHSVSIGYKHSRLGDGFVSPHCVVVVMADEHLSAGLSVTSVFD